MTTRDTITFFGAGAVGSVLLTCLAELSERDGVHKRFVVFTRDPEVSQDALFHAEHFFDRIEFVGVSDFEEVWAPDSPHAAMLAARRCSSTRPSRSSTGESSSAPCGTARTSSISRRPCTTRRRSAR